MATSTLLRTFALFLACTSFSAVFAQSTSFDTKNWQYNDCYDAGSGYSYCLNIPPKYKEKDVWPLLVFLTGSGAKGTKSQAPYLSTYSGVGYVLAQTLGGNPTDAGKMIRDDFVTVLMVAPSSAVVYDPDVVASVVNKNLDKYKTSPQLVYLTGYSMGCRGTIRTLVYHPDLFAAAVCSAGYAERPGDKYLAEDKTGAEPTYPRLGKAAGIPIAFGYGTKDSTNPGRNSAWTYNRLKEEGAQCDTFTAFPGYDHSSMSTAQFSKESVYEWLLNYDQCSISDCKKSSKSKRDLGLGAVEQPAHPHVGFVDENS